MIPYQSLLDAIQAKEFVYVGENKRVGSIGKKAVCAACPFANSHILARNTQVKSSAKSDIIETKYETF